MVKKHPVRAAVGISAALVVACGTALVGAPASAVFGDVVINPIESNIAEKFWASAVASSGTSTAELAIDQDPGTAWIADDNSPGQWLSVDLGGAYDNVRKVHVTFLDAGAVYRYVVETSPDGESWEIIADRSDAVEPARGSVELFTQPGTRYVRVTITGTSPGATVGVSEIGVYNYLRDDMILGADLSSVDNLQTREYWVHPLEEDRGAGPELFAVVKDRGFEFIRLRIWNDPRSEVTGNPVAIPRQGPERSLTSAQWVKEHDMELGIDFHYADSWADPGKQPKPRAWAELEFDELVDAMYDFTYDYVRQLVDQGTTPDRVAIGNEVNNGFLWGSEATGMTEGPVNGSADPPYFRNQASIYQSQPGGGLLWPYYPGYSDDPAEHELYYEAWDRFATLVAAGIEAVRDASPETQVEIHSLFGNGIGATIGPEVGDQEISGREKAMEFWNQLLTRINEKGQDLDVLAISYYPQWHGTLAALESNLHALTTAHPDYGVHIVESSASGGLQAQVNHLQNVFAANNDVINNAGGRVLVWEPGSWFFRAVPGMPNTWEPLASIDVYTKSSATHIVEDTVYSAVLVGGEVSLPGSVQVLTTADGSVDAVPVEWDAVPAGATDAAGQLTIAGSTEFGAVTAVVDVVAEFTGLVCDEAITGSHDGPLTVTAGVTCLDGATVSGPVRVGEGASLVVNGATIVGPVRATGADAVVICDSDITGPISLDASAVTLGNPAHGCAPNTVAGPVSVTGTVGWSVIAGNSVTGPLSCTGNAPPPVNGGQVNNVTGPKSGQCATL
jgi:arabinogalactan endo-1,4-beta-galactosidase